MEEFLSESGKAREIRHRSPWRWFCTSVPLRKFLAGTPPPPTLRETSMGKEGACGGDDYY